MSMLGFLGYSCKGQVLSTPKAPGFSLHSCCYPRVRSINIFLSENTEDWWQRVHLLPPRVLKRSIRLRDTVTRVWSVWGKRCAVENSRAIGMQTRTWFSWIMWRPTKSHSRYVRRRSARKRSKHHRSPRSVGSLAYPLSSQRLATVRP